MNFAGHYKLVQWGCGSDCVTGAVIDALTGQVWFLPSIDGHGMDTEVTDFKYLQFRADSQLLVISGAVEGDDLGSKGWHFYRFHSSRLDEVKFIPWSPHAGADDGRGGILLVRINTFASGGVNPIVSGTTNLPDGTLIQISLRPPAPECTPTCAWGWIDATVNHGRFQAGPTWPIAWKRADGTPGLNPGIYELQIITPVVDLEPTSLRSILENISGPYVTSLDPAIGKTVDYRKQLQVR